MASTFRIHPAFGVARVGDSDVPGFLGPEMPGVPANWDFATGSFGRFKDDEGRIKRQGVRFRVYEYNGTGAVVGEALAGQSSVARIEWTVHVANKKAAFFQFDGPHGDNGDFSANGARNATIRGAARRDLEIDPGPVAISGDATGPVVLANPNSATNGAVKDLGDIRTDAAGRLIFFGGHGKTLQQDGAPDISDYVNNDGWFDDVGDGPVTAAIVFEDGTRIEALGAWVSVGPPDFAPGIANVVSLYETMWDVAVRNKDLPLPDLSSFRAGGSLERLARQRDDWDPATNRFTTYRPSFETEIADLLERAFSATFVHRPPDVVTAFHTTVDASTWGRLGDPDARFARFRREIFDRMRDPNATVGADSNKMPRGLGDQYCDENEHDVGAPERDNSRRFFSVTPTQYAWLAQWASGNFEPGAGVPPRPTSPPPITPEGLDRAVLENCVGGPFFPGIEVSWTVRNKSLYAEPFRVKGGVQLAPGDPAIGIPDVIVGPGFFTQQMALPWQADFRDCKRERLDKIPLPPDGQRAESWAMWWAGQRPDDVLPEDNPDSQVPWTRAPHFTAPDDDPARFKDMVSGWSTLGFVSKQLDGKWVETERKP